VPYPNSYQLQMTPWNMGFQNAFGNQQTPQGALLQQLSSGYSPIMTMEQQPLRTGFENLPGFNTPGLVGGLLNSIVAPMLQQQMSQYGMIPGGLSSQNILDQMQIQQHQAQQFEMLGRVAQQTTGPGVVDFLGGAAQKLGLEFGPTQQATARQIGGYAAAAAPYLAQMMPDELDAISGRRGSAVVMAQRMADFNRYRLDPATGAMGFDPESTEQQAVMLFDQMYSDTNLARMRGVSAGEVGGMYQELGRRGMLPGADFRTQRDRLTEATTNVVAGGGAPEQRIVDALNDAGVGPIQRTAQGAINLDTDQLDVLKNQTDVTTQMRAFDSDKIKRSLEGYVDVVSTMKEIFGEQGRTDAPMAELVRSLEALSQGGLTQVSPGRLNQMIRTTTELAKTSGVSLDAAMMMQQQAAGQMQARGMNPIQAPQITQAGLAEGQALQQTGAFANPTWGLNDANFHRQLGQTLNIQAADSPAANAINALYRTEQALGGFDAGTEAEALYDAVNSGSGVYRFNNQDRSVADLSLADYQTILAGGSEHIGQEDARRFLMQKGANMEFGAKKNTFALIRRINQPADIRKNVYEVAAASNIQSWLNEQENIDLTPDQIEDITGNVKTAVGRTVQNMDSATWGDDDKRLDTIADAILANAPPGAFGGNLQEQRAAARLQASSMVADMESEFSGLAALGPDGRPGTADDGGYAGYRYLANARVAQNPEALEQAARNLQRDAISARMKNNMTGLAGDDWMGNFVDAVRNEEGADRGMKIGELLGSVLGGADKDKVQAAMEPELNKLFDAQAEVEELQRQLGETEIDDTDPDAVEKRIERMRQLELKETSIRTQAEKIRTLGREHGLLSQRNVLDLEDIREFQAATEETRANRADVIQGLFGPAEDDILSRGQELLGEEEFLSGGVYGEADRESQLKIAELRGEADPSKDPLEILKKLRAGEVLTEDEQKIVIRGRRGAISTIPTDDALQDYMSKLNISKEDRTPEARTAFTEILSSQLRAKKTGLNESDLSGIDVTRVEAINYLKGRGVENPNRLAVTDAQQMLRARKYQDKLVEEATGDIEGTAANLSSLDTEHRQTLENASKARRNAQTNVLYSATQGDFLGLEGALKATEQLEEARNEEVTLRGYFGSSAAQEIGVVNLANPELQSKAIAYYESNGGDPTESPEEKARLGANMLSERMQTVMRSGSDAAAELSRIRKAGGESQELGDDEKIRADALRERQKMQRDTIRNLAVSLGLDPDKDDVEIKNLMQKHVGWGARAEGRAWADEIAIATEQISAFGDQSKEVNEDTNAYSLLYDARRNKMSSQDFAKKHGITPLAASNLYEQAGLLSNIGMLPALADEDMTTENRAAEISKQIFSLESSGASVESAREKRMELFGSLKVDLTKGVGTLEQAFGNVA